MFSFNQKEARSAIVWAHFQNIHNYVCQRFSLYVFENNEKHRNGILYSNSNSVNSK